MLRKGVIDNQKIHRDNKDTDNVTQNYFSMHIVKIRNNDIDEESDDQENLANNS